jgi:hypothetical protein
VVAAVQAEHGLTPPEPEAVANPSDSRDVTLRQQDEELARLRAELARRDKEDAGSAAKADEIAALKAQLGEGALVTNAPGSTVGSTQPA